MLAQRKDEISFCLENLERLSGSQLFLCLRMNATLESRVTHMSFLSFFLFFDKRNKAVHLYRLDTAESVMSTKSHLHFIIGNRECFVKDKKDAKGRK